MPIPFLLALCVGFACGALSISAIRRRKHPARRALKGDTINYSMPVSIVLWESRAGAIDVLSGNLGYSHISLDVGYQTAAGKPMVITCRAGSGIHVRRADTGPFHDRISVKIPLEGEAAVHARACAMSKIGSKSWDLSPNATSCAEFVYECLTPALQRRIDRFDNYRGPNGQRSPNQFAKAFQVPHPKHLPKMLKPG